MRAFETNPLEVKVACPTAIILRPTPSLTPMSKSAIQRVVTCSAFRRNEARQAMPRTNQRASVLTPRADGGWEEKPDGLW